MSELLFVDHDKSRYYNNDLKTSSNLSSFNFIVDNTSLNEAVSNYFINDCCYYGLFNSEKHSVLSFKDL